MASQHTGRNGGRSRASRTGSDGARRRPASRQSALSAELRGLLEQSLRLGAEAIEIEFDDGYEIVWAVVGSLGVGLASLPSRSPGARALRAELSRISGRLTPARAAGIDLEPRTTAVESFGECTFRVQMRRAGS